MKNKHSHPFPFIYGLNRRLFFSILSICIILPVFAACQKTPDMSNAPGVSSDINSGSEDSAYLSEDSSDPFSNSASPDLSDSSSDLSPSVGAPSSGQISLGNGNSANPNVGSNGTGNYSGNMGGGSSGGNSHSSGNSGSENSGSGHSGSNTPTPSKPESDAGGSYVPPVQPVDPTPAVKDEITRLPNAEKLMWEEINRRRVAGGVSALNHCDSCEATANKQARFNAEYLVMGEMSLHGASECGASIWNYPAKTDETLAANIMVDGWWESDGHRANFMDPTPKNGGIAVYKVVRNGSAAFLAIFHFDNADNFGCTTDVFDYDKIMEYGDPSWLYKTK